jgi:GR25 family glycosyltransferase involved in LPS biosynthesis
MTWEYFHKTYCVSLKNRKDRQEEAISEFLKVGLSSRVEFLLVEKHPTNCEQGIYESHMSCIRKGLDAGAGTILIFEDDILFDRFSPDTLKNCVDFLSNCPDWNMFSLGCMVKSSRRTSNKSILKIRFRSLCHAYALNRPFAETIVRVPWNNVPLDDMFRDLRDENSYAAYPAFAFQSSSRSDNLRYLKLDRFRRLCGGLLCVQKLNELYNRKKPLIIGIHIVFIFLLIWIWKL